MHELLRLIERVNDDADDITVFVENAACRDASLSVGLTVVLPDGLEPT